MADKKKAATKPGAKPIGRPIETPKVQPIRAADVIKAQGPMPLKIKNSLTGRKGGPRRSGGK